MEAREFVKFNPRLGQNQKLPPPRKYVLVCKLNMEPGNRNPVVVGYLKYHSGEEDKPYFVTPGATIQTVLSDDSTISWCDCLPDNFEMPKESSDEYTNRSCSHPFLMVFNGVKQGTFFCSLCKESF